MQIEIPTRLSGRIKESLARDLVKALPTATEAMIREIPLWLLEDMLFCSIQMQRDKENSFLMVAISTNHLAQQNAIEAKKLREDIANLGT